VAHSTPTNHKPSIDPIFTTHPLAPGIQKKCLPGAGGVFLTRGKQEVKALAKVEAAAPRGRGGVTRGDATTSQGKQEGSAMRGNTTTRWCIKRRWQIKRLWHDKKPRNNQRGVWEAKVRQ
jgi:hypothetical protein